MLLNITGGSSVKSAHLRRTLPRLQLNAQEWCFLIWCHLELVALFWLDKRLCVGTHLICTTRSLISWLWPAINLWCCLVLERSVQVMNCLNEASWQQLSLASLDGSAVQLQHAVQIPAHLYMRRLVSLNTLTKNQLRSKAGIYLKKNQWENGVVFIICNTSEQ